MFNKKIIPVLILLSAISSSLCRLQSFFSPLDLTRPFDENSIYWPGSQHFVYTRKVAEFRDDGYWYAMNEFCTGEHGGTHLDAPYHFFKTGWKVGDIPLNRLLGQGVVVDISDEVEASGPDVELKPEHLEKWQQLHGPIPSNSILLVRFGWARYYTNKDQYLGKNSTDLHFPGISKEAAQWIANTGSVVGVGVDTASVDKGQSSSFEAHKILAEHQIYNMENVEVFPILPARNFNLIIMPMKLKEGTGAPVRVIALPGASCDMSTPYYFTSDGNCLALYGQTSIALFVLFLLGVYCINYFNI